MHSKKDIACRLLPLSMVVARKIQLGVCPDRRLCFLREVAKQGIYVPITDSLRLRVSWLFVTQGLGSEYYHYCGMKRLQVNWRPPCPGNGFLTLPRNKYMSGRDSLCIRQLTVKIRKVGIGNHWDQSQKP